MTVCACVRVCVCMCELLPRRLPVPFLVSLSNVRLCGCWATARSCAFVILCMAVTLCTLIAATALVLAECLLSSRSQSK